MVVKVWGSEEGEVEEAAMLGYLYRFVKCGWLPPL